MKQCFTIALLCCLALVTFGQDATSHTITVRKNTENTTKPREDCVICLAARNGDKLLLLGELFMPEIQSDDFKRATEFYTGEDMEILGFRVYYFGPRSKKTSWEVKGSSFPEELRQLIASAQSGERFLFEGIRVRTDQQLDISMHAFIVEYE